MDDLRVPETPEEWRMCVDGARFWLLVDSARAYGLIAGGPEVNVERCEAMLELGAAEGYHPRDDDIIIAEFVDMGAFGEQT